MYGQHVRGSISFPHEVTYVDDATQSTNGIGSEDCVCATSSILHDRTSDHDDILSRVGQLLDDKVDHLAETGILVLEQLRDTEEEGCSFVRGELLSRVEQKGDLGEEDATSSRLDRGAVEQSCCPSNLAFAGGRT